MVTRISSSLWKRRIRVFFLEVNMVYIIYFIITFLIVYLISYFLLVWKKDEYDPNKVPVEVDYMLKKYKLDIKKINYKQMLNVISIVGSLDMALASIIIFQLENIIVQLVVGFLILIPLILISFRILGKYYVKKGYVKNERKRKHKRNRK